MRKQLSCWVCRDINLEMDRSCEFAKFHKVLASLVAITTAKDHDTAQDDDSRLLSGYSGAMLPPNPPWLWLLSYNLHLRSGPNIRDDK